MWCRNDGNAVKNLARMMKRGYFGFITDFYSDFFLLLYIVIVIFLQRNFIFFFFH